MDSQIYINSVLSLCFVLGIILFFAWLTRKLGSNNIGIKKKQRISIVEKIFIDSRRKLILIRRDDKEHLVLIGGTNDLFIEKDISAPTETLKEAKELPVKSYLDDKEIIE